MGSRVNSRKRTKLKSVGMKEPTTSKVSLVSPVDGMDDVFLGIVGKKGIKITPPLWSRSPSKINPSWKSPSIGGEVLFCFGSRPFTRGMIYFCCRIPGGKGKERVDRVYVYFYLPIRGGEAQEGLSRPGPIQ
jgi:hypothetical protein